MQVYSLLVIKNLAVSSCHFVSELSLLTVRIYPSSKVVQEEIWDSYQESMNWLTEMLMLVR